MNDLASELVVQEPPRTGGVYAESATTAIIDGALLEIAKVIRNPVKSVEAEVFSRRTQTRFSYSYPPLDEILAEYRPQLAAHGILIRYIIDEPYLTTRLKHVESGEWVQERIKLAPDDGSDQARASAMTYWKRQLLMTLLGVHGTGEDDDAAASGNIDMRQHFDPPDRGPAVRPEPDNRDPLLAHAARARFQEGGVELLKAWMAQSGRIYKLRETNPALFEAVIAAVDGALNRTLGGTVADAWSAFATATTREAYLSAKENWFGRWDVVLRRFGEIWPDGREMLTRHMNAWPERHGAATSVVPTSPPADKAATVPPVVPDSSVRPPASVPPVMPDDDTRFDGPDESEGGLTLRDVGGDIVETGITDPLAFIMAYDGLRRRGNIAERLMLAEYNADDLAAACDASREAAELYATLDGPARSVAPPPMAIAVPVVRGKPEMRSYLAAVRRELDGITSEPAMLDWLARNRGVFDHPPVGRATRMQVLHLVSQACERIGITLPVGLFDPPPGEAPAEPEASFDTTLRL